jgi:Flp pilus assembly pilin Flp
MFERFWADDTGQGFADYALFLALFTLITLGSMKMLGIMVGSLATTVTDKMNR